MTKENMLFAYILSSKSIRKKLIEKSKKGNEKKEENSKEDLKPGDYIVHYDYGIGLYKGIITEEIRGMKNDYLQIKFSNNELYVPIERINLIASSWFVTAYFDLRT